MTASDMPALALMLVVGFAFVVEASLGFGSTVVTVALGALFVPVKSILPAFVPLNLVMSMYLVARYHRAIVWSIVARRVLPLMLLGLPIGMLAAERLPARALLVAFGVFVIVLSVTELAVRLRPTASSSARPLDRRLGAALLGMAGVIHGAFATGGPLVVYVVGREIGEKSRFRATLSFLWLVLNLVLLGGFVTSGRLDRGTLVTTAYLVPPLLIGLVLGEVLHHRIPEARFRVAMYGVLAVAGVALILRA